PLPGLGLAALLLGLALMLGRPLLRFGFDNVQQLHYILIFPIFVAVREVLRKIAEQLYGRSITPEQLNRGRRIGSVLAALIVAGAAVVLLFVAWSWFGVQALDPAHIYPQNLVKAALVNAAIVFGFFTAVSSLFWLRQEVTMTGPVMDYSPQTMHEEGPAV